MTFFEFVVMVLSCLGLLGVNAILNVLIETRDNALEQTKAIKTLSETFLSLYEAVNAYMKNPKEDDEQS